MSKKKKRFKSTWMNQTELGKLFGISAIAVGKRLVEAGLKDATSKEATDIALNTDTAKFTPLKDGTPYYMWNIQKVTALLSETENRLTPAEYWVNEVRERIKDIEKYSEAGSKLEWLAYEALYDDIPEQYLDAVKNAIGD